jgi:hypothetical protein
MIYQFDNSTYLLSVKKVHPIAAPGCGKIARLIKVVFEAYRWVNEETVTRCEEERIAQYIYLILSEGHSWQTQDDQDRRFLEALGLPPRLDLSVDIKKELTGRWIEGRPGPPGPDGFNSLEEFKAIESPVATAVHAASPVSGFASTSAVASVDSGAQAECASSQGIACKSHSTKTSECSDLLLELGRLPDRIVERIQPLIASGVTSPGSDMSQRPSRTAEMASQPDVPELAPGPESPRTEPCLNAKPRWDAVLRRLTWNGEPVASYRRSAPNQATILSAFEEEGWPTRIDDPLSPGQLRQTLKDLQKKLKDAPITFRADGTGEGILWTIG